MICWFSAFNFTASVQENNSESFLIVTTIVWWVMFVKRTNFRDLKMISCKSFELVRFQKYYRRENSKNNADILLWMSQLRSLPPWVHQIFETNVSNNFIERLTDGYGG